jgi:hypothetical protein
MTEAAKKSVMISFPVPGGIIQRLRKFKFEKIQECPVFFYSKNDVERIAQQVGAQHFTIDKLAKDYFLTIFLTAEDTEGTE